MSLSKYPTKYLDLNSQQTKNMSIVVEIEGVSDIFTLGDIYTVARYGDSGLLYGMNGLVYGALRRVEDTKPYLTLEGSLSISQKLEPEQGRASISTFTLVFIDKDGYMTNLVTPGQVVDEIFGGKQVKIHMGFTNSSYPDDYFVVFRGNISGVDIQGPKVSITLADANQKRRAQVFDGGITKTLASISTSDIAVPVISTYNFFTEIMGPNASYYPNVKPFIKINDEWMKMTNKTSVSLSMNRSSTVSPIGFLPTIIASHDTAVEVTNAIEIGPENGITLALMIMLSGWDGPWITDQSILSLGNTLDPSNTSKNVIVLPVTKDALEDYGLVVGDYIYIGGSLAGNDGTYTVIAFGADQSGRSNRLVYVNTDLNQETNPPAKFAIRSQFDVLPINAGLGMKPTEIDIDTHTYVRDNFLNATYNDLHFTLTAKISGKDFIESEIYFPMGLYSLTRYGRLSIGYTRPPVVIDDKLVTLNSDVIVSPDNIRFSRAINNRRFYNDITYSYDYSGDLDTYFQNINDLDTDSLNLIDQASSMTISAKGVRQSLGGDQLAQKTLSAMLTRFKSIAFELYIDVNFKAGSLVESGDVVLVDDRGDLKIPNMNDGTRILGQQLFEVIDRTLDVKTGTSKLKLLSGILNTLQDRYGMFSAGSFLQAGSTTTVLKLSGSSEFLKWQQSIGQRIRVCSSDFSFDEVTTLMSFSPINTNWLVVSPALSIAPSVGYMVEIPEYPNTVSKYDDQSYKNLYVYPCKSVILTGGSSTTSFTVASSDTSFFIAGLPCIVHSEDYSSESPETKIFSISGNTIITSDDMGFTPSAGFRVELMYFPDHNGSYRYF